MHILVAEDDRDIADLVALYIQKAGWTAHVATSGDDALAYARQSPVDVAILDVMLPGLSGLEVCRALRADKATAAIPIIMVTARADEADRIVGLEIGADDYLPKTFSTRELLARLRAVTRRTTRAPASAEDPQAELVIAGLRIHPGARTAALGDRPLVLTPVEFELLLALARAKGRVKTRDHLLEEIRDRDYEVFDRSIDVHISALRKKLGDDPKTPRFIRTVRAAGYLLIDPDADFP